MKTIKAKRKGGGLMSRTFTGDDGRQYLVFRTPSWRIHVFVETEAKAAAVQCGSAFDASRTNTRTMWEELWQE